MKFGVFYEHQIPRPWHEWSEYDQLQEALEQVQLADRLGYDYAWQVEHHFLEEYSHGSSPTAFLAAASQRTDRIRLGHGIAQLPTNHPIRVAEQAATLDLLSRGRVELGTGEGAGPTELHPFGARVRDKREMWEEGLVAMVACLTSESTAFQGKYWSWESRSVLPKPYQKPHPPLWVACSSLSTIEMAARRGLGALSFQFASPEGARAWVNRYYHLFTNEQDKLGPYEANPNLAIVSGFMCCDTDEEARAKADGWTFFAFCLEYNSSHAYLPGSVALWDEYQEWKKGEKAARTFETGLIGSPETIRRRLREFADTHVDQVILLNQAGNTRHEDICASLELFGREVMPEFQAGDADHQRWKSDVLAGSIVPGDADVSTHQKTAVQAANPGIVRLTADELKARAALREPV